MWKSETRTERDDAADHLRLGTILAIVSVVSALLLPLFPPFPSIAAIVIGHIARIRMREFTGSRSAAVISAIGLTFGYAGLLLLLFMPADSLRLPGSRELARRASCQNNLKQIWFACQMYSEQHDGADPDTLNDLFPTILNEPAVFFCPSSKHGAGDLRAIDSWSSYEFVHVTAEKNKSDLVFVREKDEYAHKTGRNCLNRDGHVDFVRATG